MTLRVLVIDEQRSIKKPRLPVELLSVKVKKDEPDNSIFLSKNRRQTVEESKSLEKGGPTMEENDGDRVEENRRSVVEEEQDEEVVVAGVEVGEVQDSVEKKERSEGGEEGTSTTSRRMDDEEVIISARSSRRICGSAASSSDSETADDAPLLPDAGPSQPVRIEIPGGDKPASSHDRFPKRIEKAVATFILLVISAALNTIVLSYVHEKYPRTPPLPDIIFDNLPYYPEGLAICERAMLFLFLLVGILIFFHRHRWIVIRRLCVVGSILYLMRCVTMIVTQVPVADANWHCAPRLGENATFWKIVLRGIKTMGGAGLNVAGDDTLCGDYIYSGHTIVLTVSALFVSEYSPRRWWIFHWICWIAAYLAIGFLVISHGHYSIDVIISYFVCTRFFWNYHTLAAHPTLRSSPHNHHRKEFWFPIFCWLESDIQRPVPRRFNVPFSLEPIQRVVFWRRARRTNRQAME